MSLQSWLWRGALPQVAGGYLGDGARPAQVLRTRTCVQDLRSGTFRDRPLGKTDSHGHLANGRIRQSTGEETTMGWASYNEDNDSRRNGTSRAQNEIANAARRGEQAKAPSKKPASPDVSRLREFTAATARPLPVLLLADISGSMSNNGKIDALNNAAQEMIGAFRAEDDSRAEIHVAVITFGQGGAKLHLSLTPSTAIQWTRLAAAGNTPMGAAFDLATSLIANQSLIPSRAYRPTIILVSDGQPTDPWESPLKKLLHAERASKADRFALAIGEDADAAMLKAFLDRPDSRVFEAHEAGQIKQFFRWVTMSVTQRSRSAKPNSAIAVPPTPLENFDF
jgi:uncharacterized protein YegL